MRNETGRRGKARFEHCVEPDRLNSWKEISSFLQRNERTAQRWHRQLGLPVHHVPGSKGSSVFAYRTQLSAWLTGRHSNSCPDKTEIRTATVNAELRALWECRSPQNIQKIIALCRRAIDDNPYDADAYGVLAATYTMYASMLFAPTLDAFVRAEKAIEKAIAINPRQIHAMCTQGWLMLWQDGDLVSAKKRFDQCLALQPNFGFALFGAALTCLIQGRRVEAAALIRRSWLSEPLSPVMISGVTWLEYLSGNFDRAIQNVQSAIRSGDDSPSMRGIGGLAGILAGQAEATIAELRSSLGAYPSNAMLRGALGYGLAILGDTTGAQRNIDQLIDQYRTSTSLTINRIELSRASTAFCIALIFAGLGQRNKVFDWLRIGALDFPFWIVSVEVNPAFSILREDREWRDFVRNLRKTIRES
jgi:tetratricopeptide (TPR) repeat protein